jgi:cytochrome c oxidase subunit 2
MERRRLLAGLLCAAAGSQALLAARAAQPQRVSVTATKFDFGVRDIRVTKGRPVTIALANPDFPHGFAIPDFNVRVDAVPGKTVEVTFTPDRAGRFVFLCDNFCGEGHDRMTGFLLVLEE